MKVIPQGWLNLDLLFIVEEDDVTILDCVVQNSTALDGPSGLARGEPVAFGIHRTEQPGASGALVDWLRSGTEVSVLNDDLGCVMLLAHRDEMVALELEFR